MAIVTIVIVSISNIIIITITIIITMAIVVTLSIVVIFMNIVPTKGVKRVQRNFVDELWLESQVAFK